MKTVRLQKDLERRLKKYAQRKEQSESSVIREALTEYLSQKEKKGDKTSHELGKDLFGAGDSSGEGRLSTTYKNRLREKVKAKKGGGKANSHD